jgi:hypothetical protein
MQHPKPQPSDAAKRHAFLMRSIKLTWPDPPGESPDWEEAHGFGTLNATWPQSTDNTAEWQVWNKAIEAAAQGMVKPEDENNSSGQWLEKWAADAEVDIVATVDLVEDDLVTASISLEAMGHGAAHPGEDQIQFNWLLKLKRELGPDDVFRKNSDWKKAIETQCSKELRQESGTLYDGWEKTMPGVVLNPRNWQLSSEGIAVNFPDYTVSPRVYPVVPVLIPWATLKPFLLKSFTIPKQQKPLSTPLLPLP